MEMHALSGITGSFSSAGLAEGTNANTFQLARAVHYAIKGKGYYKAAANNIAFTAGHTALGNSESCAFLVTLDTSGNVTTYQGPIQSNPQVGESKALDLPAVPENECPVGCIVVSTNASSTFTPGSTDLGAANVFDDFVDYIGGLPDRPENAVITS